MIRESINRIVEEASNLYTELYENGFEKEEINNMTISDVAVNHAAAVPVIERLLDYGYTIDEVNKLTFTDIYNI